MSLGRAASGLVLAIGLLLGTRTALALDPSRPLSEALHDSWQTEDGLPQITVGRLLQTRDGYLWVGSPNGLVRFDGVRFQSVGSLYGREVRPKYLQALIEDRKGGVWLAGLNGGLIRLDRDGVKEFLGSDGFDAVSVRALSEGPDGAIWIATLGRGAYRFLDGTFTNYSTNEGLPTDEVVDVHVDPQGRVMAATRKGVAILRDGLFETLPGAESLSGSVVIRLYTDRRGALWITTEGGGLHRLVDGRLETVSPPEELHASNLTTLLEDSSGTFWIGTYGAGLLRRSPDGSFTRYSAEDGLGDNTVTTLLEDREGSLWVGTYAAGLHRFRDSRLSVIASRNGLSHDFVKTVFQDHAGRMWVGTFGGGVNVLEGGAWRRITRADGLPSDLVRVIGEDPAGRIWIGAEGLVVLEGGRVVDRSAELPSKIVNAILADPDGTIWASTLNGGLLRLSADGRRIFTTADGLPRISVGPLLRTRAGELWTGTYGGGPAVLRGDRFEAPVTDGVLDRGIVMTLHEDREGSLWVGLASGELYRIKNGRTFRFGAAHGLVDDAVFALVEDQDGAFWMGGNRGLTRVAWAELSAIADGRATRASVTVYDRSDGMLVRQCSGGSQPNAIAARDGRLWFATNKGVVIADPKRLLTNRVPPPVVLDEIVVDGRTLWRQESLDLPPGTGKVEIHYTALSYRAPSRVRFRYRLEPFDADWVDAGTRRTAYYTSLRAGRYRFHVIACNEDGVWNDEGAVLPIVLQPRLVETWWFWALVGAALLLVAAAAWRTRVVQLRRRHDELESLVFARTRDLRVANAALETMNQEKNELLGLVAHDLKSPLGVIRGYSELLHDAADVPAPRRELAGRITRATQRMVQLISNLLDSSALERGEISLSIGPVDLVAVASQAIESFQPAAAAKEQTLTLVCHDEAGAQGAGGDHLSVVADSNVMLQVVDNLVSNAVKYSPRGKPIVVRLTRAGEVVRMEVVDEGPGLTVEDRARVFGKFARLSARPTGGEHSTGLGLSIVKRLVEAMHGRVTVASEAGAGAIFVVELPAAT